MREEIRYAFGDSSLGEILVARSAEGLVAFEFVDRRDEALARLRERLPEAVPIEDAGGLSGMLARLATLVDHPERPADIRLDLRGTAYQSRVWEILRGVPAGTTTTYGAVAAALGTRDVREATEAIAMNGIAILVPCHRVIKKDGSLSGFRWGVRRKRALLSREAAAVPFELRRSVA